ncbi:MAG: hypothetical protein UT58_C0011G0012 [Microgenomates group bacterium GW2011_GWC1_39_7b]|uniref:Uncharacterized protein n=3 Tax=Candidatus Woeseibacteriota TaxID=1752722 RepID=A0A0G0LVW3_9BACT|nr:MAG: hypothetical protein UT17_C0003G0158 [Candidatus Woesebacteria bacterium GW2011_GWB1_39_10]KKR26513.1 MAG: hypothetical protein UT58_C0011G0012 [Microgenomates group bacterium GW2011_GWC1_39_7b]KKR74321.1 MAG: hypothetical protein UU16_C0002G0012 [Candidatus Woesebacteria bacterium GW2011_GWA2_40_7]KKS91095.1 MAG: hypothetical protein UV66_C0001G0452 [Candidatus Woesebacteria bacterium GW2011_GWA1_43_12]
MINQNWIYVGVIIQAIGGVGYLIDTLKGKVKPNKVSWLLWSVAPLIAFFAMIKQGVGPEAWATFIVGFMPLLVFFASFVNKKAYWEITKLDYICGGLSVLGLVLWMFTRVGNIAIIFSLATDALATYLTVYKSYIEPESESHLIFTMGVVNAGIALLVIKEWNFQNYAFPIYLLIANAAMSFLIVSKIGPKVRKLLSD